MSIDRGAILYDKLTKQQANNVKHDTNREIYLRRRGWKIEIVWESELLWDRQAVTWTSGANG